MTLIASRVVIVAKNAAASRPELRSIPAGPVLPFSREGTARAGICFASQGKHICLRNNTLLGTLRPVVLSGQILGPLLGEFARAQSRGLTDFDQVAVGVPHVTANLSTA